VSNNFLLDGKKALKESQSVRSQLKESFFLESVGFNTYFFLYYLFWTSYHYRNGLAYYFSFKSNKVLQQEEDKRISDVRNYQVLDKHAGKGLDVSEYQGSVGLMWIPWKINILHFVFIRHRG
jgi:lysozyme